MKILLAILMVAIIVGFAYGALSGYAQVASNWDYRYALLVQNTFSGLDIFSMTTTELIYRARDLAFLERVIYWLGGWEVYNDYPFGVGLGNSGFYFYDRMHGAGLESYEIRDVVYRANYLPNTKNMWVRLLAETGFIGLAVFLVWLYVLWRSAGLTRRSYSKELRIVGLAGQFFLLAYLVEGFSMDSFAMPYEWIMVGLISAAGALYRKELAAKEELLPASEGEA
jgi:O-antigen ligase